MERQDVTVGQCVCVNEFPGLRHVKPGGAMTHQDSAPGHQDCRRRRSITYTLIASSANQRHRREFIVYAPCLRRRSTAAAPLRQVSCAK
jgi:hypothetical protein